MISSLFRILGFDREAALNGRMLAGDRGRVNRRHTTARADRELPAW
jgi:hypothetical protein